MRIVRSPVAQFLAIGLLLLVVISVGTSYLAGRAAKTEALAEASDANEVLLRSAIRPALTPGLVRSSRGVDAFDLEIRERVFGGQIVRINLWTEDGRLAYSNAYPVIGRTFELSEGQRAVLADGGTGTEPNEADAPENQVEFFDLRRDPDEGKKKKRRRGEDEPTVPVVKNPAEGEGQLVRVYTAFDAESGERMLFEAYYQLDPIERRREDIYNSFAWITIGGPLVLVVLVTPILWVLTRRLTSAADDRARLLRSAIDASDAERRRIARDLHDSVVQDLAGTSFSISALARDPATSPPIRSRLVEASASLRDGLKSLRSLLAEIHPPELHSVGLPAALADLTAPAGGAGVQASVSVEGAETATDERAALVWRVAQEAVRNALRHASASTLAVTVRGDGRVLVLEVVDDGVGFDPSADAVDPHSFGLRGLRSLVREAGGTLEVRSSPGEGTTVRMEVSAT